MGRMSDSHNMGERDNAVRLDRTLFSDEVVLKACYWMSKEYICQITASTPEFHEVTISMRLESTREGIEIAKDSFLTATIDFALREKIDAKTSGIRDLLLAKAFSESGVLEDPPQGVFGDKIEEENPQGMFKILNHPGL